MLVTIYQNKYCQLRKQQQKCALLCKPKSNPHSMFLPKDQCLNSKVYVH